MKSDFQRSYSRAPWNLKDLLSLAAASAANPFWEESDRCVIKLVPGFTDPIVAEVGSNETTDKEGISFNWFTRHCFFLQNGMEAVCDTMASCMPNRPSSGQGGRQKDINIKGIQNFNISIS